MTPSTCIWDHWGIYRKLAFCAPDPNVAVHFILHRHKRHILLIPLAATCAGLYIIAKNISKGIITGIICVLILFMPPVFAYITVVLKDPYFASVTFLVAALMINQAISNKNKQIYFTHFLGLP